MKNQKVGNISIKRVLVSPCKFSLKECLIELKFGRPANEQKTISKIIKTLED
jgi:hypothetical protein